MQSTSWETLAWKKHKLESRLPGEISITSDMQIHHPYGRKWRGAKKPLDERKRGEWKVGLKLNIQKMKIMASGPINSWEIHGETVETISDFIFRGSKITADGDCSHEIIRCLLLERKAVTNLDNILKSRDITLPTKCLFSQNCGFSILYIRMWELDHKEGWMPKNWCFQTVVLKKTLESPLDSKEIKSVSSKGNQPRIFTGRTDAEAELQRFGHLMQRADSFEKTVMLGKIEGRRRRGQQRMR